MSALSDYAAAFRQFMSDPRLWGVMVRCAVLSCIAFMALWAGLGWGLQRTAEHAGSWQTLLTWGGWIGGLIVALFFFPTLFGLIGGLFYETVAEAVDTRHFPHLPPARDISLFASTMNGLKYFILLLILNALAFPLYLMLLWVAGAGVILYVIVNGILFGRELYDGVALRRFSPTVAKAWRRNHRFLLIRYGIVTAALGLIPFANFIAPLLGAAAMTRLLNRNAPEAASLPPAVPSA
jgi:CysZ protein